MDAVSTCPLPVGSLLWQRASKWAFTVVCRATFTLQPGDATLAPDQELPELTDTHWDDDPRRSLRAPSDLAPLKPMADVVLVGMAYAPQGRPVRSLVARLAIGGIDKSIEVRCDRSFDAQKTLREGVPFARMPLMWERAAGGPSTPNPVGVQPGTRDRQGGLMLPNLQPRDWIVVSPDDVITPVGFGPIAPTWASRLGKLGRHAGGYASTAWQGGMLPDDVDVGYFNVAPPDQQLATLRDDDTLMLEGLHPEHARLLTKLPGIRPMAVLEARGGSYPVTLQCDTLWIDTERGVCTLTWRGQVPLAHPQEPGRVLVTLETPLRTGRRSTTSGIGMAPAPMAPPTAPQPPQPEGGGDGTATLDGTMNFASVVASATLPFAPAAPPPRRDPLSQSSSSWSASPVAPTVQPVPAPAPVPAPRLVTASASAAEEPWNLSAAPAPVPRTIGQMARTPEHAADAVFGGVAAASAAAVAMAPRASVAAAPEVAGVPSPSLEPGTVLQLLWYDQEVVPRMRRKAAWRGILDGLEGRPLDPEVDDPAFAAEPIDIEDRREVFEILARGEAASPEGVGRALSAGVREGSKFVALVELFAGELFFPFDELEKLKATMTTVAPLVGNDENLKAAVDAAKDFVAMPGLSSTSAVAEGLTKRIKDTFGATPRATPPGYVETQTDRALLEQRHYQRRAVLGAPHLRAVLGSGSNAVPVYLPEALAAKLPMYQRFKARVIAEVHPRVDQYESHQAALKVVVVGWVMAMQGARW
jgi:hypothetical protein